MDYVLQFPITPNDVVFLNSTSIEFEVFNPNVDPHKRDSGWCDMETGARLVTDSDRVAFKNVTEEQLTLLTLKYHNRLKPLHNGFSKIYKYNADIR